jgi:hypothetical protein
LQEADRLLPYARRARAVGGTIMKQPIVKVLLLTFAVALVGCASTDARPTYVDAEQMTPQEYREAMYITRVERIAAARGIDVQWVHVTPPRDFVADEVAGEPK